MAEPLRGPVRMTRQRRALVALLESADGFRSAQDLHAELRAQGERVGLATVYAQLRQMAEAGELDVLRADGGEALWRRCGDGGHHHHLRCRSCGLVEEIDAPEVEAWAAGLGERSGFTELSHTIEVTGTCPACSGA